MMIEQVWPSIRDRDTRMDGAFVYGVLSTRIFCVASCPSRPRRPQSVLVFADPVKAEAQGFRACKRCKPDAYFGVPSDPVDL